MCRFGFDANNEFLPSFDKFQNDINKRIMFLKLFNQEVSYGLKFTKDEINMAHKNSLFEIFSKKILKNLQVDIYCKTPIKKIDIELSKKIDGFLRKLKKEQGIKFASFSLKNSLEERDIKLAVSLIDILQSDDFSFFMDGDKIFKNFVSNKILKVNENYRVKIDNDSIEIKNEEHLFSTKIFTFWQFLDSQNLDVDKHIKKAINCIKNSEFKQVYLVYPKNEKFDKHIKINCDKEIKSCDYEIKLVPYSMRSTLR